MNPKYYEFGMTVRELKQVLKNWPDTDENGDDFTVWIETDTNVSNVAVGIWPLNLRKDGADVLLKA